ncbi:hypothetical protein SA5R_16280 [Pantoea dispersa]|uniref:Uncharacterized protein n=1 Tax=Pantoea dispersa TaxID=59814 RepID=A0A8E1V7K2_9GAMM|nr:hypothetical protein SA2_19610 [Pantoea dispersa]KTS23123.1 hypothetical protein SA4R_07000 [Pantoea dispersa]KTS58166.1 hypothetical protein SA5R_16280 [Pantoea dispersa]KTS66071.1 hypothetical protein SA3R_19010 [Pantoea dispersa]
MRRPARCAHQAWRPLRRLRWPSRSPAYPALPAADRDRPEHPHETVAQRWRALPVAQLALRLPAALLAGQRYQLRCQRQLARWPFRWQNSPAVTIPVAPQRWLG